MDPWGMDDEDEEDDMVVVVVAAANGGLRRQRTRAAPPASHAPLERNKTGGQHQSRSQGRETDETTEFSRWVRANTRSKDRAASTPAVYTRPSRVYGRSTRSVSLQKQRIQSNAANTTQPQNGTRKRGGHYSSSGGWNNRFATSTIPQYDASRDKHSHVFRKNVARRQVSSAPAKSTAPHGDPGRRSSLTSSNETSTSFDRMVPSTPTNTTASRSSASMTRMYKTRNVYQLKRTQESNTRRIGCIEKSDTVQHLQETIDTLKAESVRALREQESKLHNVREQKDKTIQRLRSKSLSLESRAKESENKQQEQFMQLERLRIEIDKMKGNNREVDSNNDTLIGSRMEKLRRKLHELKIENRTLRDENAIFKKQQQTIENLDLENVGTSKKQSSTTDQNGTSHASGRGRHDVQEILARVRRKLAKEKQRADQLQDQLTSQNLLIEKNGKLVGYLERDRHEKQQMAQDMKRLEYELLQVRQSTMLVEGKEHEWRSERTRLEKQLADGSRRVEERENMVKEMEKKLEESRSAFSERERTMQRLLRSEQQQSHARKEEDDHLHRVLAKVSDLENAKSRLEDKNAAMNHEITREQEQCNAVKRLLSEREKQIAEQEKVMESIRGELAVSQSRGMMDSEHAKGEVNRLQSVISPLESRVTELMYRVKQLQSERDAHSSEKDQYKDKVRELTSKLETKEHDIKEITNRYNEASQWHSRLLDAERRYTQLSETNTHLMQRLQKMQE